MGYFPFQRGEGEGGDRVWGRRGRGKEGGGEGGLEGEIAWTSQSSQAQGERQGDEKGRSKMMRKEGIMINDKEEGEGQIR